MRLIEKNETHSQEWLSKEAIKGMSVSSKNGLYKLLTN
jgi:aminoglycoside phosphotransferase